MFKRRTQQISTSLIQQYLNDFDAEDDVDQDTIHDESPRVGTSHSETREFDISEVGRPTDKVKNVRGELVHVKLKETQELTILQAAQKWAAHDKPSKTRSWREQRRACDQAGSELQRILQQQVPDLDAHVRFAQSNAKAQAEMSAGLLSRALEAGLFLEDKSTSMPQELEKFALETYLFGSMTDILYAREEAAKMLARMDTVGRGLDAFLDAASSQYREYEGLSDFLNPAASFSAGGDAEVQLAEKYGPRRDRVC
ncbi:hypothetical protein N0V95_008566 [Ascochyta clinopodiicola]|nr:hypothetical protein N0V95_008566 [Ascochyta clinopodiicola]